MGRTGTGLSIVGTSIVLLSYRVGSTSLHFLLLGGWETRYDLHVPRWSGEMLCVELLPHFLHEFLQEGKLEY